MTMDSNEKIVVCDRCSAEFFVKSVKIDKCSVEVEGKQLMFTYFQCPECKKVYRILLVDEQKYCELVDDLSSLERRMRKCKGNHNPYAFERLQNMAAIKKSKIQEYVNAMHNKYPYQFVAIQDGQSGERMICLPRDFVD